MIASKQTHVTSDSLINTMALGIPGGGTSSGEAKEGFPKEELFEVCMKSRVLLEREKE